MVLSLILSALVCATAFAQTSTFGVVLSGNQETPPVTTSGSGNATVTLTEGHTSITVAMTIGRLTTPATLAHIHEGPAGVAGPIRLDLAPSTNLLNGRLNASYTIPKELGDQIAANPQNFYINLHTATNPGGEIRGQLTPIGSALTFIGEIRGSNEVPANSSAAVGAYFITLDFANNLTWEVTTSGIASPTLSHIHSAVAGVNGPVVVNFATSAAAIPNGRTKGTIQLTEQLAASIRLNPAAFYVNVHSSAFPGGELRGQLTTGNEYDISVAGKVSGSQGEKFVTDARIFNTSYDSPASVLVEYFQSGAANANATSTIVASIPARGTAVLDDIAGPNFLKADGTVGGVRVSSSRQLAVTSRIYNDRIALHAGTVGQFVAAVPRANALRRGVLPNISHDTVISHDHGSYRTNVGFFNPTPVPVAVRLELRNADGSVVGTNTITLGAFAQQQNTVTAYFPNVTVPTTNLSLSFDAAAPILGYASIVDNVSTDQVYVAAQEDLGVLAQ
jgi:hypothetical protein